MGDRGAILVKHWESEVYLYTHWDAHSIEEMAKSVMSKKLRWNDGQYLSRMIFEKMITDAYSLETGYGISSTMPDAYRVLIVDCDEQKVALEIHGDLAYTKTFEEFISS